MLSFKTVLIKTVTIKSDFKCIKRIFFKVYSKICASQSMHMFTSHMLMHC